jgi:fluoride exporter
MMLSFRVLLLVGCGGMIGAMLRFIIMQAAHIGVGHFTVIGTLMVNVIGSFAIGALHWYGLQHVEMSDDMKNFLIPGMLGGFTTFSTFALDSATLFGRQDYVACAIYILSSVVLSILALLMGMWMMRWVAS